MAKQKLDDKAASQRIDIIQGVRTPLGFFVLVVLVVEALLGITAGLSQGPDRTRLINGMLILIFLLVVIVTLLAFFRPEALGGKRPVDFSRADENLPPSERKAEPVLELDLHGNKVAITTSQLHSSQEEVAKFDPRQYYIDSARKYSFKLPTDTGWSQPAMTSGLTDSMVSKGVVLNENMREMLQANLSINPLGPMLHAVEMLRMFWGKPISVEITDKTSNELLDTIVERVSKAEGVERSSEEVAALRRRAIGFERLNFANEFTLSIFNKSRMGSLPIRLSLPGFFVGFSTGIGFVANKLVANERSILAGVSVQLQRAKINGRPSDFRVDRSELFAEGETNFYLVEIAFSPQTGVSIEIWEQLRTMMNSFRIF